MIKDPVKRLSYPIEKPLGSGAFGTVYLSYDCVLGTKLAIKKIVHDVRYKNREVQVMESIRHSNIIRLVNSFVIKGTKDKDHFLCIVMDYYPLDLLDVINSFSNFGRKMPLVQLKLYSYQLIRALLYLDLVKVCHRDIKPQNVLIDPITHKLVICDFGCAKKIRSGETNISYICSRYYRAPELILGSTSYNCVSDMWSVACVICEMMIGRPIFWGKTSSDQLVEIMKVLGNITKEEAVELNPRLTDIKLPEIRKKSWDSVFNGEYNEIYDLLDKMLAYSPSKRITPLEALQHPFFDELRKDDFKVGNGRPPPALFDWNQEEINNGVHLLLTPNWVKSRV
jgi:protein brassinosteroid insensitive 2